MLSGFEIFKFFVSDHLRAINFSRVYFLDVSRCFIFKAKSIML